MRTGGRVVPGSSYLLVLHTAAQTEGTERASFQMRSRSSGGRALKQVKLFVHVVEVVVDIKWYHSMVWYVRQKKNKMDARMRSQGTRYKVVTGEVSR